MESQLSRPWPSPRKQPLPSKEQLSERPSSLRRSREGNFSQLLQWLQSRKEIDLRHGEKGGRVGKGVVILNGASTFSIFLSLFPREDNISSEWRDRIAALFCRARSSASLISHSSGRSMAICVSMLEERERGRQTTESCKGCCWRTERGLEIKGRVWPVLSDSERIFRNQPFCTIGGMGEL